MLQLGRAKRMRKFNVFNVGAHMYADFTAKVSRLLTKGFASTYNVCQHNFWLPGTSLSESFKERTSTEIGRQNT